MAENNTRPEVTPEGLLKAIEDMRADFTPQTQSNVINLVIRSTFLVPAVIEKNTELVQDGENRLKFQEHPQAKFMIVKHEKNGQFFPVFTDEENMKKLEMDDDFQGVKMKFADIATLTEQTPNIEGFVINPMSTNLPFTKGILAQIKKVLQENYDKIHSGENGGSAE